MCSIDILVQSQYWLWTPGWINENELIKTNYTSEIDLTFNLIPFITTITITTTTTYLNIFIKTFDKTFNEMSVQVWFQSRALNLDQCQEHHCPGVLLRLRLCLNMYYLILLKLELEKKKFRRTKMAAVILRLCQINSHCQWCVCVCVCPPVMRSKWRNHHLETRPGRQKKSLN